MEWRNPERLPDGRYDCEVRHPQLGWIPLTASPNDALTAEIHAAIAASGSIPDKEVTVTALDVTRERERRERLGADFPVTGLATSPVRVTAAQRSNIADADQFRDAMSEPIPFEDANGVRHQMTRDQIHELALLGAAYVQQLHTASYTLRQMDPIPADYTDDGHWT